MFFILSKTASFLLMPATLIGLSWLAYFILKRWRYRKYLAILGFALFIIFTNDFLANAILKAYQTPVKVLSKNSHYTYGVLLTGMTNTQKLPKDRVYFHQNADRMLQSIKLFYEGKYDTLLISGGGATALRSDLQEARVLSSYLESINFPMDRVLIEDKSRNTVESAKAVKEMIKADEVLLITSASHMPRAKAVFEKHGFNTVNYPTVYFTNDEHISPSMFIPSADALLKWHVLFKEWMGMAAYKVAGYI